jgi:hypothetical protein
MDQDSIGEGDLSRRGPEGQVLGALIAISGVGGKNEILDSIELGAVALSRIKSRRFIEREVLWAALGTLVFTLAFTWPVLWHLREFGSRDDWDLFTSLSWIPYYTVRHFHQLPLWDPYRCGGLPMLGNPQARIATPSFLLILAFGPFVGMHLELIAHIAAAFAGTYVLGRVMGVRPLAASVAGAMFGSTSWFYMHAGVGHQTFLAGAYLPWIAALFWLSIERESWALSMLTGLLVASTFLDGAVYIIFYAAVVVVALACGWARVEMSIRPIGSALVVGISSLGFAAVKLIPALEMIARYPRAGMGAESNPLSLLPTLLFSRNQPFFRLDVSSFGFQEFDAWISIAFAALALIGLFTSRRRSIPWLILAITFILFYMGDSGPYAPWTLAREYLHLMAMRLPARCLIGVILSLAVLAALGAEAICTRMGTWGTVAVVGLLAYGLADSWLVSPPHLKYAFIQTETPAPRSDTFKQTNQLMSTYNMVSYLESNIGVLRCYEFTDIPTKALAYDDPKYRGEQFLTGPGTVTLTRWTPNALSYSVDTSAPNELVLNRNYDASWRLVAGKGAVVSENTLLAVRLPAGRQQLKIAYRSFRPLVGAMITLVTFAVMIAVWRRERRLCRAAEKAPCSPHA